MTYPVPWCNFTTKQNIPHFKESEGHPTVAGVQHNGSKVNDNSSARTHHFNNNGVLLAKDS